MAHSDNINFRKSEHQRGLDVYGGTIVNLLFALIFLGLIAYGVWWVIKSYGQAGEQYTQTMIDAKYSAETVKCQTNLRAIAQNIQIYGLSNEGFPPSLDDLVQWSGSTQMFKCPAPGGGKYVYISGQNGSMPAENVLVYEAEPVHNGRCSVLRLGGQIELLSPEELGQALDRTRASLR